LFKWLSAFEVVKVVACHFKYRGVKRSYELRQHKKLIPVAEANKPKS